MTLRHLRIFIEVYRQMNMTRAAEVLHMTQPAVTRSIHELESWYGVNLFERLGHRLYGTDSGDELYAHALHIVESFDDMEKKLRGRDDGGIVRCGGSVTLGNILLPQVVSAFGRDYPAVDVRVMVANSAQLQQALLDNTIDFAVLEGRVDSPYLVTESLAKSRLVLLLPAGHSLCSKEKISLKDISECKMLVREKGSSIRATVEFVFALNGLSFPIAWESISTLALIRAAAEGLGVAILPERLVRDEIADHKVCIRPLDEEMFFREICLVWHRQKRLSHPAGQMMKLCRMKAAEIGEA